MKRLNFRAMVWKDQGMLLYLSPDDGRRLTLLLHTLVQCLGSKSRSEESLHAIRRDLSDLLYSLSPLSKTGKILFELLERTQSVGSLDKKNIQRLIAELSEIYQATDLERAVDFSKQQIAI